jgi:hypothetical protein
MLITGAGVITFSRRTKTGISPAHTAAKSGHAALSSVLETLASAELAGAHGHYLYLQPEDVGEGLLGRVAEHLVKGGRYPHVPEGCLERALQHGDPLLVLLVAGLSGHMSDDAAERLNRQDPLHVALAARHHHTYPRPEAAARAPACDKDFIDDEASEHAAESDPEDEVDEDDEEEEYGEKEEEEGSEPDSDDQTASYGEPVEEED